MVTLYKIRCLVVCGTYDENIYWPEDGYNGDELWRANGARFRSQGTIEEIWHHEHVADIFQPVTQHYKLEFALDRYPECETADTPTTTVSILGNDVPFTGWEGYAWVNTRTCMGRGHYAVNLTFRVDGRQVNGTQRIPQDVTREFYDYAIYDSPSCPSQEFTWQHLADGCLLVGCKSTETEIADAVYGGVNGHISTGCICGESFQYIWLGAITDPVEGVPHRDGMCCCRAKGMSQVMQVLGVPQYTTIVYVNERPEPNAERLAPDGTCTVCGLVYRAYWAGFWNNWLGACRSHGEKSIAYAPSGSYKGNYYQIYTDLAQDFGFVWVGDDTNEECTHGLPAPPPPPDP